MGCSCKRINISPISHNTPRTSRQSLLGVTPIHERESKTESWILESTPCILDSSNWIHGILSVELGFWIPLISGIPDSTAKICLIFDSKSKHFLGSGIWFHLHGLIGEWLCSGLVKQSRTNGKIYPFKSTHVNLWVKGVFNRLFSSLSTLKIVYGDRFQSLAFAEDLECRSLRVYSLKRT